MDDLKLERYLQSTAKGFFIDYYDMLADLSIPNRDVITIIRQERDYTSDSCATRVSKARSIIKAGRGDDALRLCL